MGSFEGSLHQRTNMVKRNVQQLLITLNEESSDSDDNTDEEKLSDDEDIGAHPLC